MAGPGQGVALQYRQAQWPVAPAVPGTVAPSPADARTAATDQTGRLDGGSPTGAGAPGRRTYGLVKPDPNRPTGPPPSFDTTPLEAQSEVGIALSRIGAIGYQQTAAIAPAGAERPGPAANTSNAASTTTLLQMRA